MFQKRVVTKINLKNQNNTALTKPDSTPTSYSKFLDMTI